MIIHQPNKQQSGFTLMEMTVTIVVGLMIASMSLMLFNQQLASFKILKAQNFLVSEAPHINNTLHRIVSRANFFRMYATIEDAEGGQNAVIADGKVLALKFEDTGDQTVSNFGVIAFDATTNRLDYYYINNMAELAVASPEWSISTQLTDADFYVENGVLRMKLSGPYGEEIIYSSTTLR